MKTHTEDELKALLPKGVEMVGFEGVDLLNCSLPRRAVEADLAKTLLHRKRELHIFYRLDPGARCDSTHHPLMSRIANTSEVVQFFEGQAALQYAKGEMPADFAWFNGRRPEDVHFVCGFCASAISDNWAEAEAEGLAS